MIDPAITTPNTQRALRRKPKGEGGRDNTTLAGTSRRLAREERRKTGVRADFDGPVWITEQAAQILRAKCPRAAVMIEHLPHPRSRGNLPQFLLNLPLEIILYGGRHR